MSFNPSSIGINLPKEKKKIIVLSDHVLSPSGVGVQTLALINGLIQTGRYTFKSLGGAIKHGNYDVMKPHPDLEIKPVDGFGSKEQLRKLLLTEQPDAILMVTDPRQFVWVWEMEDEIRQVCPITYWHVWDNDPYPDFNGVWYRSTDLINCLSWKTFELVKPNFPEKTNYIPHAFPKEQYFPISDDQIQTLKIQHFGDKADWFKVLWVNRNATRKLPADVMACWKEFLDELEKKHGHRKALLVMHTDPADMEGPNLYAVNEMLKINENVMFSVDKLQANHMNMLHNLTDTIINIAKAEGFGLSTLISMMVGKPIIALCTGGETRQVIDWRDGSENGVAIQPASRQMVGSQMVPYIYEDFSSHKDVINGFMKIFEMTNEEKINMKRKVLNYVDFEFSYQNMIKSWDETLSGCINNFKGSKWTFQQIEASKFNNKNKEVIVENSDQTKNDQHPIDATGNILKSIKIIEGI